MSLYGNFPLTYRLIAPPAKDDNIYRNSTESTPAEDIRQYFAQDFLQFSRIVI